MWSHFEMKFEQSREWAALHAAEQWCRDHGISVGEPQGSAPRGLMLRNCVIGRWEDLSREDREELDGTMTGDLRHGPLVISLKMTPEGSGPALPKSLGQIAYEASKPESDRQPWGILPGWARESCERAAQAVADAVRPQAWVVCTEGGDPIVPFDCNPEFEADEGMLVYRSREAAEASARHQESLYGGADGFFEGVCAKPLTEVLARLALAINHSPSAGSQS